MNNKDISADGRIMGPCRECGYRVSGQDTITREPICAISGRDVSRLTGGCPVFKKRIEPAEKRNYYRWLESSLCQYKRPVAGAGWRDKVTGPQSTAQEDKLPHRDDCYIYRNEKDIATMIDSEGEKVFSVPAYWGDAQMWHALAIMSKAYARGLATGKFRKENEIKKALGIES